MLDLEMANRLRARVARYRQATPAHQAKQISRLLTYIRNRNVTRMELVETIGTQATVELIGSATDQEMDDIQRTNHG